MLIGSDAGVIFILELPGILGLPGTAIKALVWRTRDGVQRVASDRSKTGARSVTEAVLSYKHL
jgi:hypothetical protein